MSDTESEMTEAIAMLSHSQSAKRRAGAKRLRKLGDPRAGEVLLLALKKEIRDPRTWETQYQMIAAIGECSFREALPYLRELAVRSFEATMVYTAIGDAIVRLSRKADDDVEVLLELIDTGNPMLITGGMQAMAMLRISPSADCISKLISYARLAHANDSDDWSIIWVLRAAPGWQGARVEQFLRECAKIPFEKNQQLHTAAELALAKKYQKWSPL
jgi:hypothetical protein